MIQSGSIDPAAARELPAIDGPTTILTQQQSDIATKYLADNWAKAIG